MGVRKIIHVDMDAFYASIEQRDNPALKNCPIIVGGLPQHRGVVATASYEARTYGIHSAMPSSKAQALCPHVIFVKPRFDVYKAVSQDIRAIFKRYTDLIEPLSLDEAYLDVTQDKYSIGSALEIAQQIKSSIKEELLLTASAGVSINKFVAKIASDLNKPDGLTFIGPSKIETFIENLPVEKFHGIGKVTAKKMNDMQIYTGADLKSYTKPALISHFGKVGNFFYDIVRGIDNRPVQPFRELKSIGAEDTFTKDLSVYEDLSKELCLIAEKVMKRLEVKQVLGSTLTLKVKFSDFKQITRNHTQPVPIAIHEIPELALNLLNVAPIAGKSIRLLGLTLSNFKKSTGAENQLLLF